MNLENYSTLELLNELNNRCNTYDSGILNSQSNKKVMDYLHEHPYAQVGIALTFGRPTEMTEKNHKCSRCGKVKSSFHFKYYLSRIDSDGYLMRTNAICDECSKEINDERRGILNEEKKKGVIGETPEKGDVCPNCDRKWYGKWHRHHNAKTSKFSGWVCGYCNMEFNDQRILNNPDKILSKV